MSTTPHPIAPEEIMAHLDGELAADRSQSVSAHLDFCRHCQAIVTSLRSASESLANWTVAPTPTNVNFQECIESAARNNAPRPGALGSRIFHSFERWSRNQLIAGFVFASAAVLLFVVLVRPKLDLSQTATSEKMSAAHVRLELVENGKNSIGLNSPPVTDQQSKVAVPHGRLALESGAPSLNSLVTLSQPGAAADSNGLFHGFGDHAQNSFSLDGQPVSDQQSVVFSGPMIARTVTLSLFTKNFDSARASLDDILARHNGYAAELNVATPRNAARSLQASLRIPASQLSAALAELKSLGRVENESQTGEEVTQQHADLVARLKNSRETEQRLQAILTERTGKIKDVLEVEQEIARVRGEIEEMEAEQKNLEHRVDFATINLQLSEEYKAKLESPAPGFSTLIHNAAINGYRNVADTILSLVLFLAEFGPVLLLWAGLLFVPGWFVWRRWRHAAAAI